MAFLPGPRQLTASLVSSLSKPREPDSTTPSHSNPLDNSPLAKEQLLTLHVLFPNELLPALDLLDRGLVARLCLLHTAPAEERGVTEAVNENAAIDMPTTDDGEEAESSAARAPQQHFPAPQSTPSKVHGTSAYYVRSAQQQSSRSNSRYRNATHEHTSYYEVRLDAWSCSCPAFAFSAFPANTAHRTNSEHEVATEHAPLGWCFGGLTLGNDMPICKHLLACILVEHSSIFSHSVEERLVSTEEIAGWSAGWGD
ncbi:hypothetical protein B0A50_06936 [Salinomyces thailandicus]|uniref:SWIM-type domain-containing protein n=1 Tax=Salinomyces thailandicus TaxID=706561 RepID=A0A4U0TQL2_9PEZI|nr:hypothetical protein B0A50_06936 [Salinomyces thailandica]